jgi:hypothetical protein
MASIQSLDPTTTTGEDATDDNPEQNEQQKERQFFV